MDCCDHVAITNLLAEYPEHFDAGDFDAFGALFAHGTWFSTAGEPPGAEPVRRWCEENIMLYDGRPNTRHCISNVSIELDREAGTATTRSYVTVWQALVDFPLRAILVGRYVDRLERLDGSWWFRERDVRPDLIGDLSRHMRIPPPPGPLPM
jgi:3-phenylpropionate/cinnamic acid dioxygenase small subunit